MPKSPQQIAQEQALARNDSIARQAAATAAGKARAAGIPAPPKPQTGFHFTNPADIAKNQRSEYGQKLDAQLSSAPKWTDNYKRQGVALAGANQQDPKLMQNAYAAPTGAIPAPPAATQAGLPPPPPQSQPSYQTPPIVTKERLAEIAANKQATSVGGTSGGTPKTAGSSAASAGTIWLCGSARRGKRPC